MRNLQFFRCETFGTIRALEKDEQIYFIGKDVAEALGYSNTRDAVAQHIKDNHKADVAIYDGRQNRKMVIIDEAGLYSLVMRAKTEKAEAFQEWVTSEVLPSIRKHGGYLTPQKIEEVLADPDTIIKLATNLKAERAARQEAENKLEEAKPKIIFADAVSASKSTMLIGDLAKLLKQNGVDIGQKRLFEWLRSNGYLIKRFGADYNSPTQYAMELGLFNIKETAVTHSDGHVTVSKTVKVTGKGQQYFINQFAKAGKMVKGGVANA